MQPEIIIRKLQHSDIQSCMTLFHDTVHTINFDDYTQSQLDSWATHEMNMADWMPLLSNITYVAEYNHVIVGFADMTPQGHLDHLYVHKDFQRKGIASALVKKLEEEARNRNVWEMASEFSLTAKPMAEKLGFKLIEQCIKEHREEKFIVFVMKKQLMP